MTDVLIHVGIAIAAVVVLALVLKALWPGCRAERGHDHIRVPGAQQPG